MTCPQLVVFVKPFFHEFYVSVVVFYETHVTACTEEFPPGIGDSVIHVFCNVRGAQIVSAVDN